MKKVEFLSKFGVPGAGENTEQRLQTRLSAEKQLRYSPFHKSSLFPVYVIIRQGIMKLAVLEGVKYIRDVV